MAQFDWGSDENYNQTGMQQADARNTALDLMRQKRQAAMAQQQQALQEALLRTQERGTFSPVLSQGPQDPNQNLNTLAPWQLSVLHRMGQGQGQPYAFNNTDPGASDDWELIRRAIMAQRRRRRPDTRTAGF